MTNFKRICSTVALTATLSLCMTGYANENATAAPKTTGTIIIQEKDPTVECSVPSTPGDHIISRYSCTNDQAYAVRFVNVPSALNITFFDDKESGKCQHKDSWEIEVRTIKSPTTTEAYMNLESMAGAPNGSIIEPGVLKVRYINPENNQIHGKLSCVRVEDNK